MAILQSVNIGRIRPAESDTGVSAIDKRPVDRPVMVRDPGPKGSGDAGLEGDSIGDPRHHGGHDQALYAYAREQVTAPRIPCRTFAGWMRRSGWVKTFTERGVPGAYLRVLEPGWVGAGDPVVVEHRPDHEVTIGLIFRALTTEPDLLPLLLEADDLPEEAKDRARRRLTFHVLP